MSGSFPIARAGLARAPFRRRGRVFIWRPRISPWRVFPALILLGFTALAGAPGHFAPYLPTDMDDQAILTAPAWAHPLGTDQFGRDILSLVIWGTRDSLLVGLVSAAIGTLAGGAMGLIAGTARGRAGLTMRWALDVWLSVPRLLLAIVLVAGLGPGLANVAAAIGLVSIPRYAGAVRARVIDVRHRPFIEAARTIGTPGWRILLQHVLPHCLSVILVLSALAVGAGILMASALSFLGLGVTSDTPDWGYLVDQGQSYLTVAWWFATAPALAIALTVISVNLLADALHDRLDPKRPDR